MLMDTLYCQCVWRKVLTERAQYRGEGGTVSTKLFILSENNCCIIWELYYPRITDVLSENNCCIIWKQLVYYLRTTSVLSENYYLRKTTVLFENNCCIIWELYYLRATALLSENYCIIWEQYYLRTTAVLSGLWKIFLLDLIRYRSRNFKNQNRR